MTTERSDGNFVESVTFFFFLLEVISNTNLFSKSQDGMDALMQWGLELAPPLSVGLLLSKNLT